ncbi:MAG: PfkB family carbohydrate kinase [Thermomicrobiales bacterium]
MTSAGNPGTPDFVAIGHFTVDRMPWGAALGGSVAYAALAAARSGARVGVLTRGDIAHLPRDVRRDLELVSNEVELVIQSSRATTTFTNAEVVDRRVQTLHAWGGEIDLSGLPPDWRGAPVMHIAPVAQELDPRGLARLAPGYLGVTPQGWIRRWDSKLPSRVRHEPLKLSNELASRFDSMVASSEELAMLREPFEAVSRTGLAVVTRGRRGATAIDRGRTMEIEGFPGERIDTTGAGDVFAAILFLMRGQGQPLSRSLRFASAAAALSVAGRGISAIPSSAAVEELVEIEDSRP